MSLNPIVQDKLKDMFQNHIPAALYMTYEELSRVLGSTPRTWETFLDLPETQRFVEQKLNKYLQVDARKALNNLASNPNLSSTDISALKHIIDSSHLLKAKAETKQSIIVLHYGNQQPIKGGITQ